MPEVLDGQRELLGLIMKYWLKDWKLYYRGFPNNYTVIDLETTGLKSDTDLITEYGVCEVRDREIKHSELKLLDWTKSHEVDQEWLKNRIVDTKLSVDDKYGEGTYKVSYDRLSGEHSQEPDLALSCLHELLEDNREDHIVIVGHNFINCDMHFIKSHFKRFLGTDYEFGPNEIWDTGVLEKAAQLGDKYPWPRETFAEYGNRIHRTRAKGIAWNLHKHCVKEYGLDQMPEYNSSGDHTAEYDAKLTHYLFEKMRDICDSTSEPTD